MLRLLFASTFLLAVQAMSLCEYYEKLGEYRPECGHVAPVLSRPLQEAVRPPITPRFAAYPVCRHYFHSCMSSSQCESGTICSNGAGPGSCCTDPARTRCPTATALNINCRKSRGVNWCNSDFECHGSSTMPSMCCPTGCNYNMCIHVGFNQAPNFPTRSLVFSSRSSRGGVSNEVCPDPYLLNVRCVAAKTTSWCLTDNDCPHNSLHPRKCCTTVCGYNTCVIKYAGKWQIA